MLIFRTSFVIGFLFFIFISLFAYDIYRHDLVPQTALAQFQGPNCAAGSCAGKIGSDSSGNLSIGTSSVSSTVRFLISASNTLSSAYGLKVIQPAGPTLFSVRNDGLVSVPGTLSAGTLSASIPASSVTPGVFNGATGGNYSFNGSLGVNTTTQVSLPQPLSVYGNAYINGSLSLQNTNNFGYGFYNPSTSYFGGASTFEGFLVGNIFSDFGQGAILLRPSASNGRVAIYDYLGTTQRLAVFSTGQVGIGTSATTTAPTSTLSVAGSIAMTGSGSGLRFPDGTTQTTAPTGGGSGFSNMKTWISWGTYSWTIPAGVTKVMVEVWGGGGRGGSASATVGGRGGGGGGWCKQIISVTAGTSATVVVGRGGVIAVDGENSSFTVGAVSLGALGGTGAGLPGSATWGIGRGCSASSFTDLAYGVGADGQTTVNTMYGKGGVGAGAFNYGGDGGQVPSGGGAPGRDGQVVIYY